MDTKTLQNLLKILEAMEAPGDNTAAPETRPAPVLPPMEPSIFWQLGDNYYIRTVTHILTGKLVDFSAKELVLTEAAWVADTGRYADAMASGAFEEVEPYPAEWQVLVNRETIVDAAAWPHALPREQK